MYFFHFHWDLYCPVRCLNTWDLSLSSYPQELETAPTTPILGTGQTDQTGVQTCNLSTLRPVLCHFLSEFLVTEYLSTWAVFKSWILTSLQGHKYHTAKPITLTGSKCHKTKPITLIHKSSQGYTASTQYNAV